LPERPDGCFAQMVPDPFSLLPRPVRLSERGHQLLTLEGGVRFPYGLLTAEYANPVKRPVRETGDCLWVRLPPRLLGDECTKVARTLRKRPGWVRFPSSPLPGRMPEWFKGAVCNTAGSADRRFESCSVHCRGSWSNGTTPVRQTGNPGSIPGGSTEESSRIPVGRAALLRRFSYGRGGFDSLAFRSLPSARYANCQRLVTARRGRYAGV
jgi:hypothetical protein